MTSLRVYPSSRGLGLFALLLSLIVTVAATPSSAQAPCPRNFSKVEMVTSVRYPSQVNVRAIDPASGDAFLVFPDFGRGHQRMSRVDLETGQEVNVRDLVNVPVSGSLLRSFITPIVGGRIYLPGQPGIWVVRVDNGQQVAFLDHPSLGSLLMLGSHGDQLVGYRRPSSGEGELVVLRASNHQILGTRTLPAGSSSVSGIAVTEDGSRIVVGLADRIHFVNNQPPYPVVATVTRDALNLNGVGAAFYRLITGGRGVWVVCSDQESSDGGTVDVSYLYGLDGDGAVLNLKPIPRGGSTLPHLGVAESASGFLLFSDGSIHDVDLPTMRALGSVEPPDTNFQYNNVAFHPDGNRGVLFDREGGTVVSGFEGDLTFTINGVGPLADGLPVLVGDENHLEICSASDGGNHYLILASSTNERSIRLPGGGRVPFDLSGRLPALTHFGTLTQGGAAVVSCVIPPHYQGMTIYYTVMTYVGDPTPPTTEELQRIRSVYPMNLRINVIANQ